MSHTPGPWCFWFNPTGNGWSVYRDGAAIGKEPSGHVAEVYGQHVIVDNSNAQLIAAAPDLLAACQSAEMAMSGFLHPNPVIGEALKAVRAAIAKAKGAA